jgi:hypothetical protein
MKIFILLIFISNISLAKTQSVTPFIDKYNKNENIRITPKTKHIYSNVDKDIGKTEQELYYGKKNKPIIQTQIENPYFIQISTIRNSLQNRTKQQITESVVKNIEEKQIEKIEQKSQEESIPSNIQNRGNQDISLFKNINQPIFDFFSTIKITDEKVAERPTGMYKGFLMSFMTIGTTAINGNEERPSTIPIANATNSNSFINYSTFSTDKTYLPSIELGIFAGWQINTWIRSHLDVTWTYLYGNIGNVTTQSGSPKAHFVLPKDFFDGNLFASTMNIFFDPYQNLKIWPTIGVGGGVAFFVPLNYNNNALLWPVVNLYLGANYMLPDNKTIISFGYKLQYLYTGIADNKNPITDANGVYQDGRPTNQDQSVFFGLWIHKLELAIRFY